jgi:hypothetical protein
MLRFIEEQKHEPWIFLLDIASCSGKSSQVLVRALNPCVNLFQRKTRVAPNKTCEAGSLKTGPGLSLLG